MTREITPRQGLTEGMTVECPRRSISGAHEARIVELSADRGVCCPDLHPRTVVSLDCGHTVNLGNGHGLFQVVAR